MVAKMTDPRQVPTRRPQGSSPELDPDELVTLGQVMQGQARLEKQQQEQAEALARIESAWEVVRREHETTQRQSVQLMRQFETLIEQQNLTQRMIGRLGKAAPAVLALVELVRYVVQQYLMTHPH